MRVHADLHVHSKYSRAASRDLDLAHIALWACRKGIGVVATSPFLSGIEDERLKQQRGAPMRRKPEDRQLKLL
jgi:PHP family Zn ribbon phosphoesterase